MNRLLTSTAVLGNAGVPQTDEGVTVAFAILPSLVRSADFFVSASNTPEVYPFGGATYRQGTTSSIREDWRPSSGRGALYPAFFAFKSQTDEVFHV